MSLTRKTVFGCKQQATINTAIALAATDYFLIDSSFSIKPSAEVIERDFFRSSVSMIPHITGKRMWDITVKTEHKFSGSPGVAYVPFGALLQAATLMPTVVAVTSVTYDPSSAAVSGFDSIAKPVTCEIYLDGPATGVKLVVRDAVVVSARLSNDAGKYGTWEFTIRGLWNAIETDAAFPTQTYIATLPAILQSATITIDGVAPVCISNLEFGIELEVSEYVCASAVYGLKSLVTTGRKVTAKADPVIVAVATHAFFDKYFTGASMALSATWTVENGGATPQKVTITAPYAQYSSVGIGDRSGLRTIPVELALGASEAPGDDEIKLAYANAA